MPVVGFKSPGQQPWYGPPYYSSEPAGLGMVNMNNNALLCAGVGAFLGWVFMDKWGAAIGALGGWLLCGGGERLYRGVMPAANGRVEQPEQPPLGRLF